MEFRAENIMALKTFRRSMLQYAADLNGKINDLSPVDFERVTKFFIQTEIGVWRAILSSRWMSAAEKYETPSISIGIEASAHSRSTIVGLISRSRPEIAVRQARLGAGRVRGHHVKPRSGYQQSGEC
jgi:hypothetical protein